MITGYVVAVYVINRLVLDPGGYRFSDFIKVGIPLQILAMLVTLLTIPLLFPLTP